MKRIKRSTFWITILAALFLVGCSFSLPGSQPPASTGGEPPAAAATPTLSGAEETQIAQLLTAFPTNTPGPVVEATATEVLPTFTPAVETATPAGEGDDPAEDYPVPADGDTSEQATATVTPEAATGGEATATATPDVVLPTSTATPLVQGPTATLTVTATAVPGDPRARLGSPTSIDHMNNDSAWIWPVGQDEFTKGSFHDGYMEVTAISEADGWRMTNPMGRTFQNTYIEATMRPQTCSGSDHYGIILRVPEVRTPTQGYLFGLTCDGRYSLRSWDGLMGTKGDMEFLINWTATTAFVAGPNQVTRLGIMAVNDRLTLYINGQKVNEFQDKTYTKGYFGVFVGSDVTKDFTVHVDEMAYWEDPQP